MHGVLNCRKSLILQKYERSVPRLQFGQKFILKMRKNSQFGEFLKNCQTVLPDRSDLIGQKIGRKSQN